MRVILRIDPDVFAFQIDSDSFYIRKLFIIIVQHKLDCRMVVYEQACSRGLHS